MEGVYEMVLVKRISEHLITIAELENDKKKTTIEGLKYIADLYAKDNHHEQDIKHDLVRTVMNKETKRGE